MVKITDVARRAGVSPCTVSYALSGKRPISDETRRRVEAAARDLGHRPHTAAPPWPAESRMPWPWRRRSARRPRPGDDAAGGVGGDDGPGARLRRPAPHPGGGRGGPGPRRHTASVAGLLLTDVELHDSRLPRLRSQDRPSVLIGVPAHTNGLTCVDLDFRAAGEACVDHLARLGHRTVALVGSPPEVYLRGTAYAHHLMHGFTTAATRHGLASSVHPGCPDPTTAPQLAGRLLHLSVTAVCDASPAPGDGTGEYVTPNGMTKAPPQISDGAFAHMG